VYTSWINSDFMVVCILGGITWQLIQARDLEHARSIAVAWELERIPINSMGMVR
jgi:hypothetical protein